MAGRRFGPAALAVLCWGTALVATTARTQRAGSPSSTPPAAVVSYEQIRPILTRNCLDCHNQDKRKGGLSLATYDDVLEGGKDGPIVRPGNSAGSLLIHRVTGANGLEQMPKDDEPLTPSTIATMRAWIDQGARLTPTSPPAPQPWEAALAPAHPAVPAAVWPGWTSPIDRFIASYLNDRRTATPSLGNDATFARRAYLDIWGLLPPPADLESFVADSAPDKRRALVERLLLDGDRYADHWMSFWNDLLRNDDGTSYFSETNGRKSITLWLLSALRTNMPYDQFVSALLNPRPASGPEGFLIGVNWRGETSAAVTPAMQAAQNTAQVFMGLNLKCNSCHDSFISRWKLKDAYNLATYFSPESQLRLYRCDVAQDDFARPAFLYSALSRPLPSDSLADRRATIAAIFTDPRNGRLPRTLVNRIWQRLLGHGLVGNTDEMDGRPWDPALLDWLASDFADHGYDMKRLVAMIVSSRAYQLPSVPRPAEPATRGYVFAGPEVRRMTAEQFADAIGTITGEWSVSGGNYAREWRNSSTDLTRALGRPIRDQVTSVRTSQPTTPQALELVNGETLTHWLKIGAERMLGVLPPDRASLVNKTVTGRLARPAAFDIDVSKAARLWMLVTDYGSNLPASMLPVWAQSEFVDAGGRTTPLSALVPTDSKDLRAGSGLVQLNGAGVPAVRVANPSTLVIDITGRGFTRLRGTMWLENPVKDIGQTLDPQLRFFVFDGEPDMDRLLPPSPATPLPRGAVLTTTQGAVTRVFQYALGRPPTAAERAAGFAAVRSAANPSKPSPEGLADLLWAVLMKPEFQFIY